MATIAPLIKQQFLDANGNPLSYGIVYTYNAGTTNTKVTWIDAAQSSPNTNPILLDSRGQADIWLYPGEGYKFVVMNSSSVLQYTVDNVTSAGTMSTQNANAVAITGGSITGVTITGPITGDVTGNLTGDVTGNVSGSISGGTIYGSSYNGGQLAGMRNKIINGAIDINQRRPAYPTTTAKYTYAGTTSSGTNTAVNALQFPDRWSYIASTSAVTSIYQKQDAPPGLTYSLQCEVTTADASVGASDFFTIVQTIEGYEVKPLTGTTFTISFWVKSAVTGSHTLAMWNSYWGGSVDQAYTAPYTILAANTWEYKTITVTGGLPATGNWSYDNNTGLTVGWTLCAGTSSQSAVTNTWIYPSGVLGTSNQVNVLGTIGNVFAITGVQIETGTVATPFERRPTGIEYILCQRYYEKSFAYGIPAIQNLNSTTNASYGTAAFPNQAFSVNVTFAVAKRNAVGVTTYAPDALSANWSTNTTTPIASTHNIGERGFAIRGGTATTAGNSYSIHWEANAEM